MTVREIRRAIRDAWDLTPATVERLVAGHDAHAWGYRVQAADGTAWSDAGWDQLERRGSAARR